MARIISTQNFHLDSKSLSYAKLARIGIIIIIIGVLITMFVRGFGPRVGNREYMSQNPLEAWAQRVVFTGAMIFYLGVALLSYSLLSIALFGKNIHLYLRIGLIIGVALILGNTLGSSYYLVGIWM